MTDNSDQVTLIEGALDDPSSRQTGVGANTSLNTSTAGSADDLTEFVCLCIVFM